MFANQTILIVEDETLIALGLAAEVEALDGRVAGPARSVADALVLLDLHEVAGAILDVHLLDRNIVPVALVLAERRVPFVVHSGTMIPLELAAAHPKLHVVPKPTPPYAVIAHLLATMAGD